MAKKEYQNELGKIYGSRISKSGKYLNLLIVSTIAGKDCLITVPVAMYEQSNDGKKPSARYHQKALGVNDESKAMIIYVPVYKDKAKAEEPKTEEPKTEEETLDIDNDELPFISGDLN